MINVIPKTNFIKAVNMIIRRNAAMSHVTRIIQERMSQAGQKVSIPLIRNGKSMEVEMTEEGIYVSNLHTSPFLPWDCFELAVELLRAKGGEAIKGDAMSGKLGDSKLPIDSVEGFIAYKLYDKKIGDSVFRRITPVAAILIWAGICENAGKRLVVKENFLV
ncbi:hypothetical protein [Peribacillus sp. SCS-37]|uniref:hypothetical protein n=1 Tax=Paraperibacillus esterisolvens TaxID=3115296 RepID=UPI003905898C